MPGEFPQFMSLPRELQLMIFEEFLMHSLTPRIVLLDTAERQIFAWDHTLLGWDWHVPNRYQLQRKSPVYVAAMLSQVNTMGRDVAARFLVRRVRLLNPPRNSPALRGLGLCLMHDVFWLPDDLAQLLITTMGPPVQLGPSDEDSISNIIISIEPFQQALRWATQPGEEFEESVFFTQFLRLVLTNIVVEGFPATRDLIVMVGIPRGDDVPWDQIEVVRGGEPALARLELDHVPGRCQGLFLTYEALNTELELFDEDATRDYGGRRALPQLSFRFPRRICPFRSLNSGFE